LLCAAFAPRLLRRSCFKTPSCCLSVSPSSD
jgi:hypothetical protein